MFMDTNYTDLDDDPLFSASERTKINDLDENGWRKMMLSRDRVKKKNPKKTSALKKYRREYYLKNRDKMIANSRAQAREKRVNGDSYSKDYYEKNKDKIKATAKKYIAARSKLNREFVMGHLIDNPCVDCGNHDLDVLEFDHVRGEKSGNVSYIMVQGSLESLKIEVAKCDVRCSNCHKKKTRSTIWESRYESDEYKKIMSDHGH